MGNENLDEESTRKIELKHSSKAARIVRYGLGAEIFSNQYDEKIFGSIFWPMEN